MYNKDKNLAAPLSLFHVLSIPARCVSPIEWPLRNHSSDWGIGEGNDMGFVHTGLHLRSNLLLVSYNTQPRLASNGAWKARVAALLACVTPLEVSLSLNRDICPSLWARNETASVIPLFPSRFTT